MSIDEPLSALDLPTRRHLQRLLGNIYRRNHGTVIHVTHDLTEAFQMATDIAIIANG